MRAHIMYVVNVEQSRNINHCWRYAVVLVEENFKIRLFNMHARREL